jgi:hypothetical protein
MASRWALVALSLVAACRPTPTGSGAHGDDAPRASLAGDHDGSKPQVQLTWRLFETQHWLDGDGPHQSAIFELLVDGGTPSRVQLGRRDSSGCVVHDEIDGGSTLVSLSCSFAGAVVLRASDGELRVDAFDEDAAQPDREPVRRRTQTVRVRIPVDADVAASRELARIPDEAVPGTSVP